MRFIKTSDPPVSNGHVTLIFEGHLSDVDLIAGVAVSSPALSDRKARFQIYSDCIYTSLHSSSQSHTSHCSQLITADECSAGVVQQPLLNKPADQTQFLLCRVV